MTKKRKAKSSVNVYLVLFAIVLFVISAVCLFLDGCTLKLDLLILSVEENVKISDIIFGTGYLDFSFLGLILLILVFAALAFAVLSAVYPKKKFFPLIAILAGIGAGIMFFLINQFIVVDGKMYNAGSLAFGAIMGGITSSLGSICLLGAVLIEKK